MCTGYKWGSDITPKTPSGGHASLGITQQSQQDSPYIESCLSSLKSRLFGFSGTKILSTPPDVMKQLNNTN